MEALLDFSKPVDVPLLDRVVLTFFDATNPQVRSTTRTAAALRLHGGPTNGASAHMRRDAECARARRAR